MDPANQPTFKFAATISSGDPPGYLFVFYDNKAWNISHPRLPNILEPINQPTLSPPQQYQVVIHPVIYSISTTKKRGKSPTQGQKPGNTFNPSRCFTRQCLSLSSQEVRGVSFHHHSLASRTQELARLSYQFIEATPRKVPCLLHVPKHWQHSAPCSSRLYD